jgi:hypothetical protein
MQALLLEIKHWLLEAERHVLVERLVEAEMEIKQQQHLLQL